MRNTLFTAFAMSSIPLFIIACNQDAPTSTRHLGAASLDATAANGNACVP